MYILYLKKFFLLKKKDWGGGVAFQVTVIFVLKGEVKFPAEVQSTLDISKSILILDF